jgi:alpha-L-fucosidase
VLFDKRKWENAMTLDLGSWGYRHNFQLSDVISIEALLEQIIITVSCGGNILINVGPTQEGTIAAIFEERFRQMGQWLAVFGESIYDTQPWLLQNDTFNQNQVWYTSRISQSEQEHNLLELYAITFKWPKLLASFNKNTISLNASVICSRIESVSFLGYESTEKASKQQSKKLNFFCREDQEFSTFVDVSDLNPTLSQSEWTWVIKITMIL